VSALAEKVNRELTNAAQSTRSDDLSLESGGRARQSEHSRLQVRREAIKQSLRSGEIPKELSDEVRLVPLDSPAGIRFQNAMEEIAKRFSKDWDPTGQPVRFGLMDLPGVNACQVRGAEPPLILFNTGCFKETVDERGRKAPPLKTVDELALVFAHEQVHLAIERRYNPERNSKLEESMASYSSVEAAYLAGFDPRAAQDWQRNRVSPIREWCWSEVLDEHPTPANALSIYETALTALNRKYGAIRATETPLVADSDLSQAAHEGRHTSTLEQRLSAKEYLSRPIEKKVEILTEVIQSLEFLDSRRLNDLCQTIRALRTEIGNDRATQDRYLAPIFDAALSLPEVGYERAARRILTWVADTKDGYRPIGRLAPLAEACRAFVEASDLATARAAAQEVVRLSDAEPLINSTAGIQLLRHFAFPQFDYPDPDTVARLARKGGGVPISWNGHVKFAAEERTRFGSADVARAMLMLGVDDERLYGFMDDSLAVDFFTDGVTQISAGPRDGSSTVHDLTIARGRAIQISISRDDRPHSRDQVKLEFLSKYAADTFERLAGLSEGETREALIKELNRISLWVSRVSVAVTQQSLLGLRSLEAAPELFVSLNRSRLSALEGQQLLLARLRELHAEGHLEEVRKVFLALNDGTAVSPPVVSTRESVFGAWKEFFGVGPEARVSPFSSGLLKFAFEADPPLFSADEKVTLLAEAVNWLGLLDYSLSVKPRSDDLTINESGRKHLIGLLSDITPVLEEAGIKFKLAKSWDALEAQIDTLGLETHPLGQQVVMAQAGILLSKKSAGSGPTTAQIVKVLDRIQGQIPGESVGVGFVRNRPQRAGDLTPYIREGLAQLITDPPTWSPDLGDAIRDWQTLYRAGVLSAATQYRHLEALIDRVDSLPSANQRSLFFESLLGTAGVRIGDPGIRERVMKSWAHEVRNIYGVDDRTLGYQGTILEILDRVKEKFETRDRGTIFNLLAKEIESQSGLTREIETRATVITTELFAQTHNPLVMFEGAESLVVDSRERRFAVIEYLSNSLTEESIDRLTHRALDWLGKDEDDLDWVPWKRRIEGQLIDFHKNFWAAPIEARALIMKEILTPHSVRRRELIDERAVELSVDEAKAKRIEEAFRYTLERVFPDNAAHAEASRRWVKAYIDGMPEYSRHIALSALLVAGQRTAESQRGTGFAIASFLESMGPAETKAGQAAQGHPKTPDDIRADLARLKTHADEPTRWDLFTLIDAAFPGPEESPIETVRGVLGSASLYVAVDVRLKDGTDAVLSLLRPNALDRAQFGFELMGNMIERFDRSSDSFQVMRELIVDARDLAEVETRTQLAKIQRERAQDVYNGTTVTVDGAVVSFGVPSVIGVGEQHVLSIRAPGEHFIDLPASDEKRRLAKAIMAVELNNILSGRPFDNDRHGGNCRVEGGAVHHFDFGGMMLEDPSDSDLKELGEAVVAAGIGAKSVDDFVNRYFGVLRDRQAAGEQVSPILKRAQKALLSISEYSDGMTKDDMIDVLVSAAAHELHPAVREAVEGAVMGALISGGASPSAVDLPRILGALEDPPIKISRSRR